MPIPSHELERWIRARVHLDEGPESLVLPEQALPPRLRPQVWVVSAGAPLGQPSAEDAAQHRTLTRSLTQTGQVWTPARLELGELLLDAVLIQGIDRCKAVQLGYKRKQWAVLFIDDQGMQVVYTGVNSRMA